MPLLSGEKRVSTMVADGQAGRAAFTFLIEIVGLTRGGAAPVTRTGAFGMTVPRQPAAAAWAGRLHPFPAAPGTFARPTEPKSPAPIVDWT